MTIAADRLKMLSLARGSGGATDSDMRAPRPSLSSSQAFGCPGSEQTASQPAVHCGGAGSLPLRAASISGCSGSRSGVQRDEEVVQRSRMINPLHLARTRPNYRCRGFQTRQSRRLAVSCSCCCTVASPYESCS